MEKKTVNKVGRHRLSDRLISVLMAFSIIVSTFAVAGPLNFASALDVEAADKGVIKFDDANINYSSKLKDSGDGSYEMKLNLWSDIEKSDKNTNKDISGDGWFEAQFSGEYLIELWGGDGGNGEESKYNGGGKGGAGGHVYGIVNLNKGDILYYNLGGNGAQTLVEAEGGGVNGDGGAHGNMGSWRVGGGGGYSAVYLFEAGADADAFKSGYLNEDGKIVKKYIDEADRKSKYIMVAGGGGGGGAGDGFLLGYKPVGTADGGAGGNANAAHPIEINGGTVFPGSNGISSGKSSKYIGYGATQNPAKINDTWTTIIKGATPNDWAGTVDSKMPGGSGGAGDLRGGAGGAGYCGGSGGLMASLIVATNIGGGGGGSSYVSDRVAYNSSNIPDSIKNKTNPRGSAAEGGYVDISFIGADKEIIPEKDFSWLNELTFTAEVSQYFDVTVDTTDGKATVNDQTVTLSNARLGDSNDVVTLTLKFTPKKGFAGGNGVNLFNAKDTNLPEFKISGDKNNENKVIDLTEKVTYVNVPFAGFEAIGEVVEITSGTTTKASNLYTDKYVDVRNSLATNHNYDFISGITPYYIKDAAGNSVDINADLGTSAFYTVGFTVTPKDATVDTVIGTKQTATDYMAAAAVDVITTMTINGITYDTYKDLEYDSATDKYKLTLRLELSENKKLVNGVEVPVNDGLLTFTQTFLDPGTQMFAKTEAGPGGYAIPRDGYYLIQAWGGNGGDGGKAQPKSGWKGTWPYKDPYETINGGLGGKGAYIVGYQKLEKSDVVSVDIGENGIEPEICITGGNSQENNKPESDFAEGWGAPAGKFTTVLINNQNVVVSGAGGGGGGAAGMKGIVNNDDEEGFPGSNANSASNDYNAAISNQATAGLNGSIEKGPLGATGTPHGGAGGAGGLSYNGLITTANGEISQADLDKYSGATKPSQATSSGAVVITLLKEIPLPQEVVKEKLFSRVANIKLDDTYEFEKYWENVEVVEEPSYDVNDASFTTSADGTTTTLTDLSLTWELTFDAKDGFLGGNEVPLFAKGMTLSQDTKFYGLTPDTMNDVQTSIPNPTSENREPTDLTKTNGQPVAVPANIITDFANVKLTNPITVTPNDKTVNYGTQVPMSDLFTVTGAWPTGDEEWKAYFVKQISTSFTEDPYTATDNNTFSYTYGIAPKNVTSKATVISPVSEMSKTVQAEVKINYTVDASGLNHLEYRGPSLVPYGEGLTATIVTETGYLMPASIEVKCGDKVLAETEYTFDPQTGDVTIAADKINGNITISGNGIAQKYTINFRSYDKDGKEFGAYKAELVAGEPMIDIPDELEPTYEVPGFKFVWDWQTEDGAPLKEMPAYNYWVIGSYEPLFYKLQINYVEKGTDKPVVDPYIADVWYTLSDTVVSPTVPNYKLADMNDASVTYTIDEATIGETPENGTINLWVEYEPTQENLTVRHIMDDTNKVTVEYRTIAEGVSYTVEAKKIPGYHADKTTVTGTMTKDGATVDIHYIPNSYTVTFVVDDDPIGEQAVIYNDLYGAYNELPVPESEGRTFRCWVDDEDNEITNDTLVTKTENHKLYAKWIEIPTFTVTSSSTDWTNKDVTFTFEGTNTNVDYSKVRFYYSTDGETYTALSGASFTATAVGEKSYYFKAVNVDGGEYVTGDPSVSKIDREKPEVKIDISTDFVNRLLDKIADMIFGGEVTFFNETVKAKITATDDLSDIAKYEYYIDYNAEEVITDYAELEKIQVWQSGDKVSVAPDAQAVIYAKVTDNAGNYAYAASYGFITDKTAPTIENPYVIDGAWVTEGNEFQIKVSDNLAGLESVTYQIGDKEPVIATLDENGAITITASAENGFAEGANTVVVTAKDNSKNENTVIYTINFDVTAPTGTISIDTNEWNAFVNEITFGLFFKDMQEVTITADDKAETVNGSGIDKIYYYKSSVPVAKAEIETLNWTEYDSDAKFSLAPEFKGVVYVKLVDNVGNVSYLSSDGVVFTTVGPIVDVQYDKDGQWINKDTTVEVKVTETKAPIEKVEYSTDGGNTFTEIPKDENGKYLFTITQDGVYDVRFVATDEAGNKSTPATINVKKDSVQPVITVSDPTTTSDNWGTKDTAVVTVNETPEIISEISLVQYRLKGSNDTWKAISLNTDEIYSTTILENGTYEFCAVSNAGNVSDPVEVGYKYIDSVVPEIEVTAETADGKAYDYNAAPWVNQDVIFTFTNKSENISDITYTVTDADDNVITEDFDGSSLTLKTHGTYNYTVTAVSASGVGAPSPVSLKAKIDKENPTGTVSIEKAGLTWEDILLDQNVIGEISNWLSGKQEVKIETQDADSQVAETQYLLAYDAMTLDELKATSVGWTTVSGPITLENDNKYVVYVRIMDNAGNVNYISSDGFILDSTAPNIYVAFDGDSGNWVTDSELSIPVTIYDNPAEISSGVDITKVKYTYSDTEYYDPDVKPTDVTVAADDITKNADSTYTFTIPNDNIPLGEYTITVSVMDKAGNEQTRVINVKRDDGIKIIAEPESKTVTYGEQAEFEISVFSNTAITGYQWQVLNPGEENWNDISDSNSTSLTVERPTVVNDNGKKYRVVITSESGSTVTTGESEPGPAVLTVNKAVIEVTPDRQDVLYGQDDPTLTFTWSGDMYDEHDNITFVPADPDPKFVRTPGNEPGKYVISAVTEFGLDPDNPFNGNYNFIIVPAQQEYLIKEYNPEVSAVLMVENDAGKMVEFDPSTGWSNKVVHITAPDGYLISRSNSLDPAGWSTDFILDDGIYANGEIVYYLRENSGENNKAISVAKYLEGFKQDTVEPEVKFNIYQDDGWVNDLSDTPIVGWFVDHFFNKTVHVEISDANAPGTSNTTTSYYVSDKKLTPDEIATINWTTGSETTVDPGQQAIVYAKIVDEAGNEAFGVSYGFVTDDVAPEISDTYSELDKWVTTDDDIVIGVTDDLAHIAGGSVQYKVGADGAYGEEKPVALVNDELIIPGSEIANGVNTVVVTAVDNSSNKNVQSITVRKDTVTPTVLLDTATEINKIEQSKVITIDPTVGESGVAKVEIQKDGGAWVDITANYADGYKVTENGTYTVRVTNGAGVESEAKSLTITQIDTAKPELVVATAYETGTWSPAPVDVIVSNKNTANLGDTSYYYLVDGGTNWEQITETAPNGTHKFTVGDSETNAGTTYQIKAVSASGVDSEMQTLTVKVDQTAPTEGKIRIDEDFWDKVLEAVTFGIYKAEHVEVEITADCAVSGLKSIRYIMTETPIETAEELQSSDLNWQNYNGTFEIPAVDGDKFIIYAEITDNAGHVIYLSSSGYVFDTTAPVITVGSNTDATTPDGGKTYADRVVTVEDENLEKVIVKVTDSNGAVTEKEEQIDENGKAVIKIENDGSTYEIYAVDKAGNRTPESGSITIETGTVEDFINALPTDPQEAIKDIDEFLENEYEDEQNTNLTPDEKEMLDAKRDELLNEYKDQLKDDVLNGDGTGALQVNVQIAANAKVSMDETAVKTTLIESVTDKDYEKLVYGGTVVITLTAETVANDVPNSAKADSDGNAVIKHIDITITKIVTRAGDTVGATTRITKTEAPLTFKADVSDYAKDGREFTVYRDHGNASAKIAQGPATDNTVTYTSDLFSVFTIAYAPDTMISGIVTDKEGDPIDGAEVVIKDSDGNVVGKDVTGPDGKYDVGPLPDGDYTVEIILPNNDTNPVVPDSKVDVTVTPDGKVETDGNTDVKFDNYDTTGPIAGTVVGDDCDGDGKPDPVPGATVELINPDGTPVLDENGDPMTAVTGKDGGYSFDPIKDGEYTVKVTAPDGKVTNQPVTKVNNDIDPDSDEDGKVDPIKVDYKPSTDITGNVTDKEGNPVEGAEVIIVDKNGDPVLDKDGNPITGKTDENGDYILENVPDGEDYEIVITAPNPNEDGTTDKIEIPGVDVENGVVTPADPSGKFENYDTTGPIAGVVLDKDGKPVPGAKVELKDENGKVVETTETDENGNYIFDPVKDGDYTITATPPNGDADKAGSIDVNKANNIVTPDTTITLDDYQAYTDITGTVTDKDGNPVPGATVDLIDKETGEVVDSVITDGNGDYIFPQVPDGEYEIKVTAPNPDENGEDVTVTIPDVEVSDGTVGPDTDGDGKVDGGKLDNYDTTGPVEGTVVGNDCDGDGKPDPVPGATVELIGKDGTVVGTVTTDKDGNYKFDNVTDGDYTVKVTAPDGSDTKETEISKGNNLITPDIDKNNKVDSIEINYNPKTDVTGKVTDKDGNPVDGAEVVIKDENGNVIGETTTDKDGNYTIENVPDGTYDVEIIAPYPGTDGEKDKVVVDDVTVENGSAKPDPSATLPNYDTTGPIEGTVTGNDCDKDGKPDPIPGAEVELLDKDGKPVIGEDGKPITTTTDENGNYKFDDVPDGEYQIKVTPPNGDESKSETIDNVEKNNNIVTPSTDSKLDYSPYTDIEGTVIDKDGNPVGGAIVELQNPDGTPVLGDDGEPLKYVTGADGNYVFPHVPDGEYKIVVAAPNPDAKGDYDSTTIPKVEVSDGKVSPDADNNGKVDDAKLPNYSTIGDITGNVTNKDGEAIPGAKVELKDETGNVIKTTETDKNGNYKFEDIPDGDYQITVTPPNGNTDKSVTVDDVTKVNNVVKPDVDASLDYDLRSDITGTVVDSEDKPVPGAKVDLIDPDTGKVVDSVTTDENGNYIFEDVPNGEYEIVITAPKPGADGEKDTVTVPDVKVDDGKVSPDNIKSDLDDYDTTGEITGTVIDKNGDPVPGAKVDLIDKETGEVIGSTETDKNGEYVFNPVDDGDYVIKVTPPDGDETKSETTDISKENNVVYPDKDGDNKVDSVPVDYQAYTDIKGTVTDKDGDPVEGAKVELLDKDGNPVLDENGKALVTETDKDGNYIFKHVPDGEYQIKVTAPAAGDNGKNEVIVISPVVVDNGKTGPDENGDGKIDGGEFNDYDGRTDITGSVTDENGKPIPGSKVDLIDKDGNVIDSTVTDENGIYIFDSVPGGAYQVMVTPPGGKSQIIDINVNNGDIDGSLNFVFDTEKIVNTNDANRPAAAGFTLALSAVMFVALGRKKREENEMN